MLRYMAAALMAVPLILTPATAQSVDQTGPTIKPVTELDPSTFPAPTRRQQQGYGRLTTNDLIGDGADRWRTGSITSSRVWGWGPWTGAAPTAFGDLLELRLQGEIMAPEDLRNVNPLDRPWAGKLSFGVHSHWRSGETEFAVGGDLVVIGPQTQLDHVQKLLHDILNAPLPSDAVLGQQIGNTFRPTLVGEVGQTYTFGEKVHVRPFLEARAGDESLLRVGADLTIGSFGQGELMIRESITGQRYRAVRDPVPGVSFVLGGDIAKVFNSVYLPDDRGYALTDSRDRVRAGLHWQGENSSIFYGATWLGREFEGQTDSQIVGSIRLQFQF